MMNMSRMLRNFRDNERGSIALECVLCVPMLLWAYLSMYSYFHAYRTHSLNIKTAYSIGDVISRQTFPIDAPYLDGMHEMAAYMSWTQQEDFALRVTSVKYDAGEDSYEALWSKTKGWVPAHSTGTINGLRDDLPSPADNDTFVVVETFHKYDPPFNMGLSDHEIHNFVFTRPRYAPQVCWVTCDPLLDPNS